MDPDEQPKPEGTSIPVQFDSTPEPAESPVEPEAPAQVEEPAKGMPSLSEEPVPPPEPPVEPDESVKQADSPLPEQPTTEPEHHEDIPPELLAPLSENHSSQPSKPRRMLVAAGALVVFALLVVLVTVLAGGYKKPKTTASVVPPASVIYTDAQTGFKITLPDGWQNATPAAGSNDSVEFRDPVADPVGGNNSYTPIITVSTASAGGDSLSQVASGISAALAKQTPSYRSLGTAQKTVAGLPATLLTFSYNFSVAAGGSNVTLPLTSDELIVIKGGQGYIVRGTALTSTWTQHQSVIENSILSFQP